MRQLTWPLGGQHEKRKRSHDTTDRGSELGVVRHADAWSDVQFKNAHIGQRTAEAIKHQLKSVLSSIVKAALSFSSAWTAGTTTEDARLTRRYAALAVGKKYACAASTCQTDHTACGDLAWAHVDDGWSRAPP